MSTEDLIQGSQRLADDVETLFEQRLVAVDVRRGAEAEGLMVALDVAAGTLTSSASGTPSSPLRIPLVDGVMRISGSF